MRAGENSHKIIRVLEMIRCNFSALRFLMVWGRVRIFAFKALIALYNEEKEAIILWRESKSQKYLKIVLDKD